MSRSRRGPSAASGSTVRVVDEGVFLGRVDLAYPEARLLIEAESYRHHSGKNAWQHDFSRRNDFTSRGWHVLDVTWEDLCLRPDKVVAVVGRGLGL